MVVIKLKGGLGNQLFQYAFVRSLLKNFRRTLYFDISWYKTTEDRKFLLGQYKFPYRLLGRRHHFFLKIMGKFIPEETRLYRESERFWEYNKTLYKQKKDWMIYEGFFQNEKYFRPIRKEILKDISLINTSDFEMKNDAMLKEISLSCSVCLHVRRGDYLDENYKNYYGVLDQDYYRRAVRFLEKKLVNPLFFIFSDDPDWCKKNLSFISRKILMDGNKDSPCFDLELMRRCKHFIIANSSYSWWAAWLSENQGKTVIAPRTWLLHDERANEIVPDAWIRI